MRFVIQSLSLIICGIFQPCNAVNEDKESLIQSKNKWDKNGFIAYCPCMGRFGNQADQFLGALAFAKGLNRTLVLPPWITYDSGVSGSKRVPFDEWFKIDPFQAYHKVITMEKFMANIASSIWPPGTRTGFCYSFRDNGECKMKEGNPFGPFWDHFGVNFDNYVEHHGLLYNTDTEHVRNKWNKRFPSSEYPVIAMMGAPGDFPVADRDRRLQKYLQWSNAIEKKADKFINNVLPEGPFVGIHLRTGSDWRNACQHIKKDTQALFASPQCTGYNMEYKLTREMCWPSKKEVAKKTRQFVKKYKAKSVFIATDNDPMIEEIEKELKNLKTVVTVHQRPGPKENADQAILDLAILTKADVFIGNCVSSFSAFVKRTRDVERKPSAFWMFDTLRAKKNVAKDEL